MCIMFLGHIIGVIVSFPPFPHNTFRNESFPPWTGGRSVGWKELFAALDQTTTSIVTNWMWIFIYATLLQPFSPPLILPLHCMLGDSYALKYITNQILQKFSPLTQHFKMHLQMWLEMDIRWPQQMFQMHSVCTWFAFLRQHLYINCV